MQYIIDSSIYDYFEAQKVLLPPEKIKADISGIIGNIDLEKYKNRQIYKVLGDVSDIAKYIGIGLTKRSSGLLKPYWLQEDIVRLIQHPVEIPKEYRKYLSDDEGLTKAQKKSIAKSLLKWVIYNDRRMSSKRMRETEQKGIQVKKIAASGSTIDIEKHIIKAIRIIDMISDNDSNLLKEDRIQNTFDLNFYNYKSSGTTSHNTFLNNLIVKLNKILTFIFQTIELDDESKNIIDDIIKKLKMDIDNKKIIWPQLGKGDDGTDILSEKDLRKYFKLLHSSDEIKRAKNFK